MRRFNDWLGLRITSMVGSMWCAYVFAALALVSLPSTLATGSVVTIVAWIAQTFLQLVLLSVILVGQDLMQQQAAAHANGVHTRLDEHAARHDEHAAKLDALTVAVGQRDTTVTVVSRAVQDEAIRNRGRGDGPGAH